MRNQLSNELHRLRLSPSLSQAEAVLQSFNCHMHIQLECTAIEASHKCAGLGHLEGDQSLEPAVVLVVLPCSCRYLCLYGLYAR